MPSSHAVSALTQKHSQIQGEIMAIEKELQDLSNKLNALEVSIKIFEPDFKLHEIKAKRRNNKTHGINKGEIPELVGRFVRLSDKDFTLNDLIQYIFDTKPELQESERSAIKQSVSQALRRLSDRNIILQVGRDTSAGSPIIWRSAY
ncbi:hypothetical protein EYS14_24255 [Alteromonadaceae bacterium M269]|nr:hypothetical protein EYS14_24255 [Alteromonadaceae bacterium M269]